MLDSFNHITKYLDYLLAVANTPSFSSYSGILTFLSILIVSGTISYAFTRFIKNKYLGFLVSSVASIWLYEQVFVKGLSLFSIIVSVILLIAFLAIAAFAVFVIFVKKIPIPLKIPKV